VIVCQQVEDYIDSLFHYLNLGTLFVGDTNNHIEAHQAAQLHLAPTIPYVMILFRYCSCFCYAPFMKFPSYMKYHLYVRKVPQSEKTLINNRKTSNNKKVVSFPITIALIISLGY